MLGGRGRCCAIEVFGAGGERERADAVSNVQPSQHVMSGESRTTFHLAFVIAVATQVKLSRSERSSFLAPFKRKRCSNTQFPPPPQKQKKGAANP